MPVKPIYVKPPLAVLHAVPLGPGQVRSQKEELTALYKLTRDLSKNVETWEGTFRLGCIVAENPEEEPIVSVIRSALEAQKEDGSFDMDIPQSIALVRAALALYEYGNERTILRQVALWCGWVNVHFDEVIGLTYVRTHSADLMEILEKVYRFTGKVALLSLCDRLRMGSMNWSSILHTFGIKRPMNQIASWLETRAGMDREKDSENGLYTRQFLTGHAETLADGMRAAYLNGLYSGSRDEATAGPEGWQKIFRWHGMPCGGTSADETLEGNNPSSAMDAAALGAWAESLALQMMTRPSAWAAEALDMLVHNALPATVMKGSLVPYQRPNSVEKDISTRDCYRTRTVTEQKARSFSRLGRGWAQAMSSAVMTTAAGCILNLYLEGDYALALDGKACRISVRPMGQEQVSLSFQCREPIEATVSLRIFPWMREAALVKEGETLDQRQDGDMLKVQATLQSGDVWTLSWTNELHLTEEFHQGVSVIWGDIAMVLPVNDEKTWMVAMVGKPELVDGKIMASVQPIEGWGQTNGVPSPLPILPERTTETYTNELVPYASMATRITVFPRVNRT